MIGKSSIPVLAIIVGLFFTPSAFADQSGLFLDEDASAFLAGKELLQSLTIPAKEISPSVTSDISSDASGTLAKRSVLADQYSLSNGAETSLSEIKSQNIKVKESMNKFGDTVTSTDIEP